MPAIVVMQPYATLLAAGVKDIENRWCHTRHRGPLAIAAAVKNHPHAETEAPIKRWYQVLNSDGQIPHSAVVGVVDVLDSVEESESPWAIAGNKFWVVGNAVQFHPAIPHPRGQQGMFWLDPDVQKEVDRRYLAARPELSVGVAPGMVA